MKGQVKERPDQAALDALEEERQRLPIIRTSERKDFKRCQKRWWWIWREGLRPRGSDSTPLWFGTGVHLCLATWYVGPGKKRGPHPAETWVKWADMELHNMKVERPTDTELIESVFIDAKELGRILLEEYVKKYGRDEHKLIIEPERTFSIDIPWPDGRQAVYDAVSEMLLSRYVGTYDSVWRHADTGKVWLDEHKTAKAIRTTHLPLDPQAGSYWATSIPILRREGLIGPKEILAGIEYNFIRKSLPDDRPVDSAGYATNKPTKADYAKPLGYEGSEPEFKKLKVEDLQRLAAGYKIIVLGERSKNQPPPIFLRHQVHRTAAERRSQLLSIQDDAVQMQVFRDRLLNPTKNPTLDCDWDCPVYTLCELEEKGGDIRSFKRAAYRQQDPYADHRKSASD